MITIEQLIENLKQKDPKTEVEAVIVDTKGGLVCIHVKTLAKKMTQFLKIFGSC